ncbi:MAG TPA: alanine racemase [Burkholderiales bacterium]|jgi:alanine racemase|nr:alanine racemase [Burkholderiales bacterium]
MPRPISIRFDTAALAQNLEVARRRAPHSKIWAVIKADAYGHGLLRAADALRAAGGYALLDLNEAASLREAGFAHPILLLEGIFEPRDLDAVEAMHLSPVLHSAEQIAMLESATLKRPIDVYLKCNSGMNRLGFGVAAMGAAHARLKSLKQVKSITLMTHFADADGPTGVADQLAAFDIATTGLAGAKSMANSAATLRFPETHADWVRPGIMLYGASPFPEESAASLGLMPAMTLSSELIAVQDLKAGMGVGYGYIYRAERDMRIGVVACGYADGYPRHAAGANAAGTPILVDGVRTRTVGRVAMDMLYVDLTPVPQAGVGSQVTLWGDGLPADEVAAASGTVSYELFCALAARVPVDE